jgi:hypothetical protein
VVVQRGRKKDIGERGALVLQEQQQQTEVLSIESSDEVTYDAHMRAVV